MSTATDRRGEQVIGKKATDKQVRTIYLLSAELEFSRRELNMLTGGKKPEDLSREKASEVIDHLLRLKRRGKK